jgi:hypothetical protein
MPSPQMEVFFLFDQATGAPKTGQAGLSFSSYTDETGGALTPPSIVEIGGGAYGFTPAFTSTSHGIVYVLNCGAGVTPTYVTRYARPEDWLYENIELGRKQIVRSGGDANKRILFKPDGATVIQKFALLDENGNPTVGPNICEVVPTS